MTTTTAAKPRRPSSECKRSGGGTMRRIITGPCFAYTSPPGPYPRMPLMMSSSSSIARQSSAAQCEERRAAIQSTSRPIAIQKL